MTEFTCLSWNIHRCRGNDGRVDPARVVDVLRDEAWQDGCHALVLQEADGECPPHEGLLPLEDVAAVTGLRHAHEDPTTRWGPQSDGFLGTILFLHPGCVVTAMTLVDLPGHCHRGAVVAEIAMDRVAFRLIGTHLSLWQGLRAAQMRTISQHVFRSAPMPTVLVGDLNEWRPWGGMALAPRVVGARFEGPVKATFPMKRPLLPLDRALAIAPARVVETAVLDGPGIRMASDHRPLVARIDLGAHG